MRERFPEAEIVQDIGSALNYQRKGLKAILGRCLRGEKFQIVVAHKDRLVRFGFELIEWVVRECGCELLVLSADKREPERELAEDLLAIVHVFSCRLYGRRNYKSKANQDAANAAAREAAELVDRRLQVRLQRDDLAVESSDRPSELHGDQEIPDPLSR
jgi:predicted site-specific integrase-resolvase